MTHAFQRWASWWFAIMAPAHLPANTLAKREHLRKRRLLSIVLGAGFVEVLSYVSLDVTLSLLQRFICLASLLCFLGALWVNRRGYLTFASVIFVLSSGVTTLTGVHAGSATNPFLSLWGCFLLTIFIAVLGLFLSPLMLILVGLLEQLTLFWFLLAVCRVQMLHLFSTQELQSVLVYLSMLIYGSVLVGILYTTTTKKAVLQADRAAELEHAYATIQRLALTDELTGLPNHRAVMEQLQKELERAKRYQRPFSVLFFDGDRFKKVNDQHGHAAGDAVLRELGARAGSGLRGGDTIGRFGGEEFVVLLPEAEAHEAAVVAERIRAAIAAQPVPIVDGEGSITMTVSIGLATYPSDGTSEEELLSGADEAMYAAKRLGRNQVRTAEEARHMRLDRELVTILQQGDQREAAERESIVSEQICETCTVRAICSLLSVLERRDVNLSAHAHAVSDLATALAGAMGLGSHEVTRIGMGALIHDIGKVAMPDALLQKRVPLSSQEQGLLHEHAELGAQILEVSPFLDDLIPMVRHHHERWDGSGYPDQLRGEAIPLAARIITVAEAYDAMQRTYPYQPGVSPEKAAAELQRCAGTQFDPEIVRVLLTMQEKLSKTTSLLETAG